MIILLYLYVFIHFHKVYSAGTNFMDLTENSRPTIGAEYIRQGTICFTSERQQIVALNNDLITDTTM